MKKKLEINIKEKKENCQNIMQITEESSTNTR